MGFVVQMKERAILIYIRGFFLQYTIADKTTLANCTLCLLKLINLTYSRMHWNLSFKRFLPGRGKLEGGGLWNWWRLANLPVFSNSFPNSSQILFKRINKTCYWEMMLRKPSHPLPCFQAYNTVLCCQEVSAEKKVIIHTCKVKKKKRIESKNE